MGSNFLNRFATILAFDVKVLNDAAAYAETVGVKIMTANIIYHLFDQFTAYIKDLKYTNFELIVV